MTIELDPQGDKTTSPAFGLFSSPAEYSTLGHSLTYQPMTKSSGPSGKSRRHVTFPIPERESAYPVQTQPISDKEDDEPLLHEDHAVTSDDEDDQPLVRPATRRKLHEKVHDQVDDVGDLAPLVPPRPTPAAPLRR